MPLFVRWFDLITAQFNVLSLKRYRQPTLLRNYFVRFYCEAGDWLCQKLQLFVVTPRVLQVLMLDTPA